MCRLITKILSVLLYNITLSYNRVAFNAGCLHSSRQLFNTLSEHTHNVEIRTFICNVPVVFGGALHTTHYTIYMMEERTYSVCTYNNHCGVYTVNAI